MAQLADPYDPILSPLHGVIARRRARTILRAALACAIAVLAALLIVIVAERMGAGPFDPLPILILAGIATALVSAILAWTRRRSPVEEAFFIDSASGFDEAYGTAVELARSPAPVSTPVPAQLMATVRAGLDRISIAGLVRIFTPGFLAALALVVALGAAIPIVQRLPVPILPELAAEEARSPGPADAEALATIAEMLAEDADIRDDPLLDAIARTLADRASTPAGASMSEPMQQQINDLLDQAAATYGEDVPSWLGATEGARLAELENALATMDPAEAPGAAPELELAIDPYAVLNEIFTSDTSDLLSAAPSELAGQPGSEEIGGGAEGGGETTPNLEGDATGQGPQLMPSEKLQSIGAIPVGAALDSGRGVSSAAGLGHEDFRADDDFARLGFVPAEDMVVSAEPQAEGSRIRIEIVPETAEGGEAGAAGAIGGQTGEGSTEPVARDFVPATARDIAARYFERIAQ